MSLNLMSLDQPRTPAQPVSSKIPRPIAIADATATAVPGGVAERIGAIGNAPSRIPRPIATTQRIPIPDALATRPPPERVDAAARPTDAWQCMRDVWVSVKQLQDEGCPYVEEYYEQFADRFTICVLDDLPAKVSRAELRMISTRFMMAWPLAEKDGFIAALRDELASPACPITRELVKLTKRHERPAEPSHGWFAGQASGKQGLQCRGTRLSASGRFRGPVIRQAAAG